MNRSSFLIMSIIGICLACITLPALGQGQTVASGPEAIRVGTFDSRAVAIACYRSEAFKSELKEKFSGLKAAKESGDEAKVKALEAEGPALQHKMHLQSFGTAPIKNVIDRIKKQLPEIGKSANVQVIVSRWDVAFQQPGIKLVDVTDAMVNLFEPDAETIQVIKEIRDKAPIAAEVIKQHKH